MSQPLQGIRVLELGQFIAGPFAGLQLADLGAEVIKIERPGSGDPFREFGLPGKVPGFSNNFCAFNRNKHSIGLDIHTEQGREVFRRLAAGADIVLENFRPGVMRRLGLDDESLRAANPRLIVCSITGFSADGPYHGRPAYDSVGQAVSGLLSITVDPADPRLLGPTLSDQVTGMQACMGILAALHERSRTGQGARVEITMVEASLSIIPDFFTAYTQAQMVMGPESRAAVSLALCLRCRDERLLAVHVSSTEKFWRGLLAAAECTGLAEDPRFAERRARVRNFQTLVEVLRPIFATRERGEWIARLTAQDVPCAEVNSIPEVMTDPEVRHSGMFHTLEHPQLGPLTAMRRAVRINGEREDHPGIPPALGEQTRAVLAAAGYSPQAIARMLDDGVIASPPEQPTA